MWVFLSLFFSLRAKGIIGNEAEFQARIGAAGVIFQPGCSILLKKNHFQLGSGSFLRSFTDIQQVLHPEWLPPLHTRKAQQIRIFRHIDEPPKSFGSPVRRAIGFSSYTNPALQLNSVDRNIH
jgi:hypothetical protein